MLRQGPAPNLNYIRFNRGDDGNTGRGGAWEGVQSQALIDATTEAIEASGTYWQFVTPVVRTTFPGRVTVTCEFESFLDA